MKEFLLSLVSTQPIFGSIVISVLGSCIWHLLQSVLPPKIRNWRTRFSEKWRTRTKAHRQERENRNVPLINNLSEQQILLSLALAKRYSGMTGGFAMLIVATLAVTSLNYLLTSIGNHKPILTITIAALLLLLFGGMTVIAFHFCTTDFENASTMVDDVTEARKRQNLRVD